MYVIYVVVLLLINIWGSLQDSPHIKIQQKSVNFVRDIQSEYSIATQIYRQMEQEKKKHRTAFDPILQQQRVQPPIIPVKQKEPQKPIEQKVQPIQTVKSLETTIQKLNPEKYAEFEQNHKVDLKQSRFYVINNIDEKTIVTNNDKISPPVLQTTEKSTQTKPEVVPQPPAINQKPQTRSIVPQQNNVNFKKDPRRPFMSREQQIIDALQRSRMRPEPQKPPTPPPQITQITQQQEPKKTQIQNPASSNENLKKEPLKTADIQIQETKGNIEKSPNKYLFSVFLAISILIIVFSYSPEQQQPPRKAYNPSDDQEVNLA